MNEQDAIDCLNAHSNKKLSEVAESVDVLYQIHGSYKEISQQYPLNISSKILGQRHRLFKLSKGILWKIDEGQIGVSQAHQITRLSDEDDQWLLAIIGVERNLHSNEYENVVNLVLRDNWSIKDALSTVAGVRFEEIQPPALMLPISVDFWFALSKVAWEQGEDWQDLCYRIIRQGIDIDMEDIASRLEEISVSLRQAGERYAEVAH